MEENQSSERGPKLAHFVLASGEQIVTEIIDTTDGPDPLYLVINPLIIVKMRDEDGNVVINMLEMWMPDQMGADCIVSLDSKQISAQAIPSGALKKKYLQGVQLYLKELESSEDEEDPKVSYIEFGENSTVH